MTFPIAFEIGYRITACPTSGGNGQLSCAVFKNGLTGFTGGKYINNSVDSGYAEWIAIGQ